MGDRVTRRGASSGLARRQGARFLGRRAGASAPPALTLPTANLTLRLDPTVAKTIVDDSGGGGHAQAVSAWGANATQGTLANRGSLVTHATLGECVYLDGTSEFFDLVPGLSGSECSIYAAIDPTDEGAMDALLSWGTTPTPDFMVTLRQFSSLNFGVYDGTAYRCAHTGVDGPQLLRVLVSDANNRIAVYRNSALAAEDTSWTGTIAGTAGQGRLGIDGTENALSAARCRVRAIYVFSAYHSPTESAAVEAYMRQETPGLP